MLGLDDAVGLRVVARNPNVINPVPLGEDVGCRDIRSSVVGDEFLERAPSAQDIIENEIRNNVGGFIGNRTSFRV